MDFFRLLPLMAVTGYMIFHSLANGAQYPSALYPNSKSCVKNAGENILQSTNGMFALKFFELDNQTQYLVIAYIQYNETIIWTANRNKPIRGSKPCLKLGAESADLILQDTDGSLPWSANVSGVNRLELKDSGNLLLQDNKNVTIWASFDYPTDTIVQGGYLGSGKALVSSISPTELSEGPYTLRMEPGGVVLYASFPSPLPFGTWTYNPLGVDSSSLSSALHSACNNTMLRYGSKGESINLEQALNVSAECLQETQGRALSPRQIVVGAQLGNDFFRFLRLDNDGNVRTYIQSETRLASDSDMFSIYFQDVCKLPDICGSLGICSSGGNCSCEDDIDNVFDKFQPNVGCIPKKNSSCGASNQLLELDGIDYFANGYTNPGNASLQQCKNSCLSNCSCAAAFFFINSGGCYHYQEIKSLRRVSDQSIKAFIKVGPGSFKEIPKTTGRRKTNVLAIVGAVVCIVVIALGFLVWRYKLKKVRKPKSEEDEFLDNLPGLPPRFSYLEMEEVTEGFSTQLGAGGFGVVFLGQLADGTKVAVKKLGNADKGHLQFRAEVAALGSINHVNLVRLFGFCADGTNRLLVYEYMSNGSLDRWLFERRPHENNPSPFLDWRKRYKIIHDTAQGLAFLHDKSRDRILHLDVKPQNILVDENFEAKIADFGLAKLMDRAQSRAFTRIRGTPGYLAPEWRLHACATDKSDVYSFGMVLLEIIGGRKNLDLSKPEEMQFFPSWAMSMIEEGNIRNVVDPKLGDLADYEWKQAETVIKIAFFCIQEDAKARPSMNEVILMLEGHTEVEDPALSVEFLMRTRDRISALSCAEGTPSSAATVSNMSFSAR